MKAIIEKKSIHLKIKFDENKTSKDQITGKFRDLKNKEEITFQKFESYKINFQQLEKSSEMISQSSFETEFENLSEEKMNIDFFSQDIERKSNNLIEQFNKLKSRKDCLLKCERSLAERHQAAKKELDQINEEKEKYIKHDNKIETAYSMLETAFKLMDEEKSGVVAVNQDINSKYYLLKEEYSKLDQEKKEVLKRDKDLSQKYNALFAELEGLQSCKRCLQERREQIEWESCVMSNSET